MLSCSRLGLVIPQLRDSIAFVLSCQSGSGGFARAADALPDLTLTHLALAAVARSLAPLSLRAMATPGSDKVGAVDEPVA